MSIYIFTIKVIKIIKNLMIMKVNDFSNIDILVFYTITSEYTIIKNIYENTLFYVLKF